ncbi:sulfotransferase [Ectothiorhodospiraceae bacterium 2226]|nr:sulfotransferase [Ectothiorhodospiraceae bacterium 2226]
MPLAPRRGSGLAARVDQGVRRLLRQGGQAWGDFERALSWHVGGGRRFFERHYADVAGAHEWCFIVGCNNSGTTLLRTLLNELDGVCGFEQEGRMATLALTRGGERAIRRVWTERLDKFRMRPGEQPEVAPRLVHDWMHTLGEDVDRMIIEKTPANAVRMQWLQEVFPRSYFIGLVRNGYAVSDSIRRRGKKPLARAAAHWNTVNRVMLEDARGVDKFLAVRYEDIAQRPETALKDIARFCGRSWSGSLRIPVQDMDRASLARLTHEEVETVRRHAAQMLDHFGYADPRAGVEP